MRPHGASTRDRPGSVSPIAILSSGTPDHGFRKLPERARYSAPDPEIWCRDQNRMLTGAQAIFEPCVRRDGHDIRPHVLYSSIPYYP